MGLLKAQKISQFQPDAETMLGAGVTFREKTFITHSTLPLHQTALVTFHFWQKLGLLAIIAAIIFGVIFRPFETAVLFIAALSSIYFWDVIFNLFLILKSLHFPPEITYTKEQLDNFKDEDLPIYSILCPLYREKAVLPQFVRAIAELDWPKGKLDVLLLLETDDQETITAARNMNLPSHFRLVEVPHSQPKTKPKACNYGLSLAKGEYVVIYDAEDRPDPKQLKKAYLGFRQLNPRVVCLQAKLNYYNPHHNLLTRLFTAEYSLWFDTILTGLQSINTVIPLGGTSNHFRRADLLKMHGWDAFNVTEDCDLGVRLFNAGYQTAIIDSVTWEEANSQLGNWLRQRSRWLKGYLQTYLVHMRHPIRLIRRQGIHALLFQLVIGARISFMIINPVLWAITIAYFTLYRFIGPTIESLYPAPVFYMAAFSFIAGNFLYLYYYMIGCAKRGQWSLVKYVFFVPFYWLLVSLAAVKAFGQLIFKPHYWEKTVHGFHLEKLVSPNRWDRYLPKWPTQKAVLWWDQVSGKYLSGGVFILSSLVGNFFNFLYNAYLGRSISLEDFGLVSLIGGFVYISQVPFGAISRTITHRSAYLLGKFDHPVKEFWQHTRAASLVISLLIGGLWLALSPILQIIFQAPDILPFVIFTPVWVIGTLEAIDYGFLNGTMRFKVLGALIIVEAVTKFALTFILVSLGATAWVYSAIPGSMAITLLTGWYFARRMKSPGVSTEQLPQVLPFPGKFFAVSLLRTVTTLSFHGLDIILAKIFLSPIEAGSYALLSFTGKMVFIIGGQFNHFILPIISRHEGAGKDSTEPFQKLLFATTAVSLVTFLIFGFFGEITAPLLWGEKARAITLYLPLYALSMVFFTVSSAITTYYQARKDYILPLLGFLLAGVQVLGIVLFHDNISVLTTVIVATSTLTLIAVFLVHAYYDIATSVIRNSLDFLGLFTRILPHPRRHRRIINPDSLRILVFNWRDKRHVWAGGAEEYIHELAKRWVIKGHSVTLFCGNDGLCPRYENIDGVDIVRRGGFYFVYVWAILYYLLRFRGKYDVVIDCENGIPFFTPLYSRGTKKILLIHHVHQEVFRKSLSWYQATLATFLEQRLMPLVYRHQQVVTVSPSSKADILDHHLTKKDPAIVYNGVDLGKCTPGQKSKHPMVLYLGRLKDHKSLPVFIESARKVLATLPNVEFIIAGDGPDKQPLVDLTAKLGLQTKVRFTGRVSEEEKIRLYQRAWVFVNPSLMEGWGITTIEANACGTPVVASNVAGLRDAVYNPHSGVLVPYGNSDEFSQNIIKLITDHRLRRKMSREAEAWAQKFSWDKSAEEFLDLIARQND